jgi:hypothetical protein
VSRPHSSWNLRKSGCRAEHLFTRNGNSPEAPGSRTGGLLSWVGSRVPWKCLTKPNIVVRYRSRGRWLDSARTAEYGSCAPQPWSESRTDSHLSDPLFCRFDARRPRMPHSNLWMLEASGVTKGCSPPVNDWYSPERDITRGELSAFLARALDLPYVVADTFIDDDISIFERDIGRLVAAGIFVSCNGADTLFCPDQPLAREVTARFLVEAFEYEASAVDWFVDDDDSPYEDDINANIAVGVTRGCNPPTNDRYCRLRIVTRGEMAAFFHRAWLLR